MDYKETQNQELEALEMIYSDELEIVSSEYRNISMRISLHSHQGEEVPHMFEVTLNLRLPADYPDVAPEIEILGLENTFTSERIERVQRILCNVAQKNLGMPMVFTIVSALQDEIGHLVEDLETEKIKAEEKAVEEKEAEERKKFEGTRVTPEAFLAWKKKFDAEIRATKEKEKWVHEAEGARKLTGRQLFLRDSTLNLSDVALMQAASNEIEFDESLFDEVVMILSNTVTRQWRVS
uniref:RWD domain-containing protein n=1 Tax=Onchocerca volvulus TaxID=6282 RepID=A0A8R1Y6N5_ONCVO